MKRPPLPDLTPSLLAACLTCAGLAIGLDGATPQPQAPSPLGDTRQLVLVVTAGWDSTAGTLQRFEREAPTRPWTGVGTPAAVVVGRAGLAWGRGLHPEQTAGPVKREGDGKSPAGIFRLGTAFGHAASAPPGWRLPYLFLGDNIECVDSADSAFYNRLVARNAVAGADWSSSEKMWTEPLYKWGAVVEYNTGPAQPAAGSCIFLHIWRGPDSRTAGCTAMDEAVLVTLLGWLDPDQHPVIVQLPRDEYERLAPAWQLPATTRPSK